jgi:hypothetical protein
MSSREIPPISDDARDQLLLALRKILRPLMKMVLRAGIKFDDLCEVVKAVYIETAVRDGLGPLGKSSRARICYVTGVPRIDVDNYIDDPSLLAPPRHTFAKALSELIHRWHTDPTYLGPYGVPAELSFARGPRSFAKLLRSIDPNVDASLAAEELIRAGVLSGSPGQFLKVHSRTYVVAEAMSPAMLEHFGNAVSDLSNTIAFNNAPDTVQKRLERSVFPDNGLPVDLMPAYEARARDWVQKFIVETDDWLSEQLKKVTASEPLDTVQTGITIFQYVRDSRPPPPLHDVHPKDDRAVER